MFRALRDWRRFSQIREPEHRVVFYSEGSAYWTYFEPILRVLTREDKIPICYLTSEKDDPVFEESTISKYPGLRPYYIGSGTVRTILFQKLKAKIFVLTLDNLGTFYLKRSEGVNEYVILQHTLASAHVTHLKGAFDYYDTVFAAGPHQIEEVRALEKVYGLKEKRLIEHGYGRLDLILESRSKGEVSVSERKILIAPTWGPSSLVEFEKGCILDEIITRLLETGYELILRFHPMSLRRQKGIGQSFEEKFASQGSFSVETEISKRESLLEAGLLITDWSGIAMDFAFGLEKPVLSVDLPRRIGNPEYSKVSEDSFEYSIRSEIGEIIPPDQLEDLVFVVERLMSRLHHFKSEVQDIRERSVFNVGSSGRVGASYIREAISKSTYSEGEHS
jgi:hypothetical protein